MVTRGSHVSLADLAAAGIPIGPGDAVSVVRELARQVAAGDLPGVPSAHVIRLSADGRLLIEGPVPAGGPGVSRAAQLLDSLLPGFDAPPDLRVPGALRLVVARATGTLDLPPYPSLDSFAAALARFSPADASVVVADLVRRWEASRRKTASRAEPAPPPADSTGVLARMDPSALQLTVSDIRRARRATGLTLADIAARSRIPAWLVRELEWGYFRNWPSGQYGRTQLIRYARASGLDDELVVRTLWPVLDREARYTPGAVVPALEWSETPEWEDIPALDGQPPDWEVTDSPVVTPAFAEPPVPPARRGWALVALAVPAMLAIGLIPAMVNRAADDSLRTEPQSIEAQIGATGSAPVADLPAPSDPTPDAPPAHEPGEGATAPGPGAIPAVRRVGATPEVTGYSPAFATTGTAMFYHSGSGDDSALMRADTGSGGAILRVTSVVDDNASNFHARPSPDGTMIAFDSDRDGLRAVYIADSDGQNVRRVSGEGFAAIPSWSPDGRTLAYVRAEADRPKVWNIWTTDLQTGDTTRLTNHRVGQPWGASWFPKGDRIAYSHETRLIIRDLATDKERIFPSPIKDRLVRTPAVSPDGRRIIFQLHRDGAWLLDLKDGSMRKVLSDPTAEEYTWSPEGNRVAYHSRRSGEWGVWVMAPR